MSDKNTDLVIEVRDGAVTIVTVSLLDNRVTIKTDGDVTTFVPTENVDEE